MFTGNYQHALDPKGRVTIPKVFLGSLTGSDPQRPVFLSPSDQHYLRLYSRDTWQQIVARIQSSDAGVRNRFYYGQLARAKQLHLDSVGRICIPNELLSIAELREEVLFVGVGSHIELWSPRRFREVQSKSVVEPDTTDITTTLAASTPEAKQLKGVFISYARGDKNLARRIYDRVKKLGLNCFLDEKDISWGADFKSKIEQELASCSAVIVIVSPASIRSQWVAFEVGHAMGAGKLILPYLQHLEVELPGFLARLQYISTPKALEQHLSIRFGLAGESGRVWDRV